MPDEMLWNYIYALLSILFRLKKRCFRVINLWETWRFHLFSLKQQIKLRSFVSEFLTRLRYQ